MYALTTMRFFISINPSLKSIEYNGRYPRLLLRSTDLRVREDFIFKKKLRWNPPHVQRPRYQKPQKSKSRPCYSISLKYNEWWSPLEIKGKRFFKSSWCPLAAIQKAIWNFHLPLIVPMPAGLGQCPKQWQTFNFQALILQNNTVKRNENLTNWLTIFF